MRILWRSTVMCRQILLYLIIVIFIQLDRKYDCAKTHGKRNVIDQCFLYEMNEWTIALDFLYLLQSNEYKWMNDSVISYETMFVLNSGTNVTWESWRQKCSTSSSSTARSSCWWRSGGSAGAPCGICKKYVSRNRPRNLVQFVCALAH